LGERATHNASEDDIVVVVCKVNLLDFDHIRVVQVPVVVQFEDCLDFLQRTVRLVFGDNFHNLFFVGTNQTALFETASVGAYKFETVFANEENLKEILLYYI